MQEDLPSTPPPRRRVGSAPSCSSTRQSKRVYTDRFIPAAADTSHFEVTNGAENAVDANASPAGQYVKELAYRKELASTLLGGQPPGKVLSFSPQAPPPPDRKMDELCAMYRHNCSAGLAPKRYRRHIATEAERILDAPKLLDDFYLNLLDWSEGNVLGVALADEAPPALHTTAHPPTHQPTTTHPPIHPPATTHLPVHPPVCAIRQIYLWNAADASVHKLCETPPDTHVTSLAWAQQAGPSSSLLAVGTSDHKVQLWDVEKQRQVRSMDGHSARVSSLAWNRNLLSSGGRDSLIVHHDVRVAAHRCGTLKGHAQEVCGLRWSPWGTQLASGGNDNLLNIWDDRWQQTSTHHPSHHQQGAYSQPLFRLERHVAAVKAIAWCPWQRNLLASGGGTADRSAVWSDVHLGQCAPRARLLRLLRACLTALGGATLPGGEVGAAGRPATASGARASRLARSPIPPPLPRAGTIRFWNSNSGMCLNAVDTRSQACNRSNARLQPTQTCNHARVSTPATLSCDRSARCSGRHTTRSSSRHKATRTTSSSCGSTPRWCASPP